MLYYSTAGKVEPVSFKEAVLAGLPIDNGLFMPENIPTLSKDYIDTIRSKSLKEISFDISSLYLNDDISQSDLDRIISDAINFEAPLVSIDKGIGILELFHGPTLAFKDFGARFMSRVMGYFNKDEDSRLLILVATSGDTGSAVASGFYGIDGIDVAVLYPSGKVSAVQEQQLTTVGGNVTAFEVAGTFDDCQALVKSSFLDSDVSKKLRISSANSINISRLIPQIFYYFYGYSQTDNRSKDVVFSVPSGNFGNVTAGLFAKRMGLPVRCFISSTNINDTFPEYLRTGSYSPKPSIQTLSNAMDVGDPSNVRRINDMYGNNIDRISKDLFSWPYNDQLTSDTIRYIYNRYDYIADPHTAVGLLGLNTYLKKIDSDAQGVCLSTAHPAKFIDTVNGCIDTEVALPPALSDAMTKDKKAIKIENNYKVFKDNILDRYS